MRAARQRVDALLRKAGWDESQHPRDDKGRFGEGGGGDSNAPTRFATTDSGKEVHEGASVLDPRYADFTATDHQNAGRAYNLKGHEVSRQAGMIVGRAPEAEHLHDLAQAHFRIGAAIQDRADTAREAEDAKDLSNKFGHEVTNRAQAKALQAFVNNDGGPSGYESVNAKAAGTYVNERPDFHSEAQASVEHISAAIARSSLPEDKTLYRGTMVPASIKVGDVIGQHGFTSATSDKVVAQHFARNAQQYQNTYSPDERATNHPAMLTINAKAGQSVLDMVAARGGQDLIPRELEQHNGGKGRGEQEHLFPHQTTFRVVKDNGLNAKGYRQLHVEPIENHGGKA